MAHSHLSLREHLARFYASDVRLSLKIIATSLGIALIGATPLLLYVLLGPTDGNPVGLGLLAALGVLVGQLGLVAGTLRLAWELLRGRH